MRHALLLLPMLIACGDQRPCTTCPDLAGAYLVSWQTGQALQGCPAMGPRPANLNFSQQGSAVTVLVGGEELRGTLYDTYDFSVSGGRTETSYSLRGRAVIGNPQSSADGGALPTGVHLVGQLFTRSGTADKSCELSESYTGDRL